MTSSSAKCRTASWWRPRWKKQGFSSTPALIVQATPTYAMKAHIEVSERITVTFPLMEMRTVEREFYRFGGETNLRQLNDNVQGSRV